MCCAVQSRVLRFGWLYEAVAASCDAMMMMTRYVYSVWCVGKEYSTTESDCTSPSGRNARDCCCCLVCSVCGGSSPRFIDFTVSLPRVRARTQTGRGATRGEDDRREVWVCCWGGLDSSCGMEWVCFSEGPVEGPFSKALGLTTFSKWAKVYGRGIYRVFFLSDEVVLNKYIVLCFVSRLWCKRTILKYVNSHPQPEHPLHIHPSFTIQAKITPPILGLALPWKLKSTFGFYYDDDASCKPKPLRNQQRHRLPHCMGTYTHTHPTYTHIPKRL